MRAIFGDDVAAAAIDGSNGLIQVQRDAVVGVPALVVEHDVAKLLFAGQHRGEQNAIVVAVGLRPEDLDVIKVGGEGQKVLDRPDAGHSVADDDKTLTCHNYPLVG